MLQAAYERYAGDINVKKELQIEAIEENKNGSNAALFGESTLRRTVSAADDGLGYELKLEEFGFVSEREVMKELEARMVEAVAERFSVSKRDQSFQLVWKHIDVFRIKFGNEGPAHIPPVKIKLELKKKHITVEMKRYFIEQRRLMETYFQKLVEYENVEWDKNAPWQAPPHLVLKDKTEYRVAINLKPINAPTINEAWPMPNLEAELANFAGNILCKNGYLQSIPANPFG